MNESLHAPLNDPLEQMCKLEEKGITVVSSCCFDHSMSQTFLLRPQEMVSASGKNGVVVSFNKLEPQQKLLLSVRLKNYVCQRLSPAGFLKTIQHSY